MAEPEDDPRIATWELINSEQRDRLSRQDQSLGRVETKAAVVVGFAGTAAQFLATRDPFATAWSMLFGLIAFLAYAGAIGTGIWVMRVAKFEDIDAADLGKMADEEKTKIEVLDELIRGRAHAYVHNAAKAKRKARVWWWIVGMLAAGLVSSVACIVQTS